MSLLMFKLTVQQRHYMCRFSCSLFHQGKILWLCF